VTRRDILKRVSTAEHTIGELAQPYAMSFAAIAKHISVLEKAGLIRDFQRIKYTVNKNDNHFKGEKGVANGNPFLPQ
jgi:predicted transcriptional regulator